MSVSIASRAGYNVVALLGQAGQVLEQYVWDPYGTPVVKHTSATPAPVNRVGHQGLFWHSLDSSATFNTPDPAANPAATGLYYNRNRWYAPHLGRFLQRDPIMVGMLTVTPPMDWNASSLHAGKLVPREYYEFGCNLYEYLGSNPIQRLDPLGEKWYSLGGGNLSFVAGSWLGSTYAAWTLGNAKPDLVSWRKAQSMAASFLVKAGLVQPALDAAVDATKASTTKSMRLLYEAMTQTQKAGMGTNVIKQAIVFNVGISTGQLAYTMFTLFEEGW